MAKHPEDLLSAYVDDELTLEERQQVEEHLHHCTQCRTLAADLLEIKQQVSAVFQRVDAPRNLEQRIIEILDARSHVQSIGRNWLAIPLAGLLCLAAVWYLVGPVFFTLLSVVFKFLTALVYAVSGMMASVPALTGATALFAIVIAVISGFSLRRLLRAAVN